MFSGCFLLVSWCCLKRTGLLDFLGDDFDDVFRILRSVWSVSGYTHIRQSTWCLEDFFFFFWCILRPLVSGSRLPEEFCYVDFLGEDFQICRIQRLLVRQWIHAISRVRKLVYVFPTFSSYWGCSDPAVDSRPALRGVFSLSRC